MSTPDFENGSISKITQDISYLNPENREPISLSNQNLHRWLLTTNDQSNILMRQTSSQYRHPNAVLKWWPTQQTIDSGWKFHHIWWGPLACNSTHLAGLYLICTTRKAALYTRPWGNLQRRLQGNWSPRWIYKGSIRRKNHSSGWLFLGYSIWGCHGYAIWGCLGFRHPRQPCVQCQIHSDLREKSFYLWSKTKGNHFKHWPDLGKLSGSRAQTDIPGTYQHVCILSPNTNYQNWTHRKSPMASQECSNI